MDTSERSKDPTEGPSDMLPTAEHHGQQQPEYDAGEEAKTSTAEDKGSKT